MATDPVSETLCTLEHRTMDKVQKISNPETKKLILVLFSPLLFGTSQVKEPAA
jgi:hypothetical protein